MKRDGAKRETGKLRKENQTMEDRLAALREQMDTERAKSELSRPHGGGGSRWTSSTRLKSSSLRDYGKEVRNNKFRPRKLVDRTYVQSWSIENVMEWLAELGLRRYQQVYSENEVDGAVLLEMDASDLDFLEIRVLGHRKRILQQVEMMRQISGLGPKQNLPAAPSPSPDVPFAPQQKTRHQQQQPLQSDDLLSPQQQQRRLTAANSGGVTCSHHVEITKSSLLDGQLDEEAEQAAFRQAVEQWRCDVRNEPQKREENTQNSTNTPHTTSTPRPPTATAAAGADVKRKDCKITNEVINQETKEQEAFQQAVHAWRSTRGPEYDESESNEEKVERVGFSTFQEEKDLQTTQQRAKMLHAFELQLKQPSTLAPSIIPFDRETKACDDSNVEDPSVSHDHKDESKDDETKSEKVVLSRPPISDFRWAY